MKIDPSAHKVSVDDHPVRAEKSVYWAVNKPIGYLCTNADPAGRPRAVDLLPHVEQRVYVVGRLDEASEGLLLMTNDGELANLLTHPRYEVPKTYLARVDPSPVREPELRRLREGVELDDGMTSSATVRQRRPGVLELTLREGRKRQVRRMCEAVGHRVVELERVAFGPLRLGDLEPGAHRRLTAAEVERLRAAARPSD